MIVRHDNSSINYQENVSQDDDDDDDDDDEDEDDDDDATVISNT